MHFPLGDVAYKSEKPDIVIFPDEIDTDIDIENVALADPPLAFKTVIANVAHFFHVIGNVFITLNGF